MEEGRQLFMQPEVVIDFASLNDTQTLAFSIVKSHAQRLATSESLRMIICGSAGTGKTYLINALKQIIRGKCIVTATIEIAAFNIHEQTLHSAALLLIHEKKELQGESLQHLQLKLEGNEYLIVDEMSMIGHKMLSCLDNRLHAGTGFQDAPFGGMSITLFGDFGQLPLVGDRPLYVSGSRSIVSDYATVYILCLIPLLS